MNVCALSTVHRLARFEVENNFVLGAVILENAADVLPARDHVQEPEEDRHADAAVDDVEGDPAVQGREALPSSGQVQRNELVQENKESKREDRLSRHHPGEISCGFSFWPRRASSSSDALAENFNAFTPSHIAWPSVPTPRRTGYLKIGYFSETRGSGDSSVTISPFGFADRHAVAVRRAHHHAFDDGLAADEGLLAAFQHGKQLRVRRQTDEAL